MKIFVTGVAGFLGSYIAEEFIKDGHQVIGVDNLVGGYLDNVVKGVEFYEKDLIQLDGLSKLMKGCDIVYHTACTAYEGLSVFSPSFIVQNTFQISINVCTAAIQAGVGKIIQCSSMARYGTNTYPFREEMECKPQDPYGIAKYASELMLKNMCQVHGLDLVIAVPHNIIGPRQKYDDPFRNVASIMINLMLQGRQPFIYGDGSQVRCFSDVKDDLVTLKKMAFEDKAIGQVFNIGPDEEPITILDLAKTIAKTIGFSLDPVFIEGRPQEVKFATCSADKIRDYFGYETKVTLQQSLETMIHWIEKRGTKEFSYHLPIEIINNKTPRTWTDRLF